jgi:hypothetical protein
MTDHGSASIAASKQAASMLEDWNASFGDLDLRFLDSIRTDGALHFSNERENAVARCIALLCESDYGTPLARLYAARRLRY